MCDVKNCLRYFGSPDEDEVYLTEIISKGDNRANSKEMTKAKRQEIMSLLERGTFKVILREEIPKDANVLPGRFVLALKSTEDNNVKYKARYVIGGHRDRLKHMMVHSTSTLQPASIRLLLALATVHGFDIWTSDVRQAYLQSAEPLAREVFISKPVPEFELDPSQCLQLLKPLYGLCESGDLWHNTFDRHHKKDLGMKPLRCDPALYVLMKDNVLQGLSGWYVDELIRTGNTTFKELARETNRKFEMADDQDLPCVFTGFSLKRSQDGTFIQDQHEYLKRLEELPADCPFKAFRSMRMKLAWLANTRPDCLFEISQLAQITEEMYEEDRRKVVRQLNRTIRYAIQNQISLQIPVLNIDTLRIIGYSDSSFANNRDLSSQLGHICFLGDDSGAVAPISFKSYKARRVTRSAMSSEVIAFSDLFDVAITFAEELGNILSKKIPVQLLTDSKALFDVVSKGSRTSEKRMMLDIAAAREGFKSKTISDTGFVRSSHNVADGPTKSMSQTMIREVIATGYLQVAPEQWIIRQ